MHNARKTILVIDDDRLLCDAVSEYLRSDTVEVLRTHSAADGLAFCARKKVDVVLLDQKLPDGDGHALCPSILNHNDQTKIIFITAYPSFDNALAAIRNGAYDYLSKPFELDQLRLTIEHALRTIELEGVEQLQKYRSSKESEEAVLIGGHGAMAELRNMVRLAASTDAPVLVTGETGTGKTIVARAIHYGGAPSAAPFISLNCSSLPENLIEGELFGSEKGAFTGAVTKKGIFEMAEGGTLLLDEIGEMPLHLQSKLLSVLEDKKIRRLGGETIRPVDVRVIAATNKDLDNALTMKTFREDLYYRLSVLRIHIPPLRERKEDIPELCKYFVKKMAREEELNIPDSEMPLLSDYHWPGNVRELKNILERAVLLQRGPLLSPSELLGKNSCSGEPIHKRSVDLLPLSEVERGHITYALRLHSDNYTKTARSLGISLSTLRRKVKEYGLK
jgi:DNA-binding NtrC family response regulator